MVDVERLKKRAQELKNEISLAGVTIKGLVDDAEMEAEFREFFTAECHYRKIADLAADCAKNIVELSVRIEGIKGAKPHG